MALNTKTIKRRIKSISNTKKITKAMEMISAVKMRRAMANVLATRSYGNLAWEMLTEIALKTDTNKHPLLVNRPVKKIGLILITSNRGLAGGFNSRLLSAVHSYINEQQSVILNPDTGVKNPSNTQREGSFGGVIPAQDDNGVRTEIDVEVFLTGKQGKKIYHKYGHTVVAEFDKVDLTTRMEEILPMAQAAVKDYIDGKYDRIVVAFTDFVSAVNQMPKIKQLLPIVQNSSIEATPASTPRATVEENHNFEDNSGTEYGLRDTENDEGHYLFEPNTREVLDILLPRLVEMQIYQAILESDASEHSARMVAMHNASDAAGEMIKELQNSFNKARQAAITQEISEIVGGAAALE